MLCTNYTCVLQIALFYLVNIDMGEGGRQTWKIDFPLSASNELDLRKLSQVILLPIVACISLLVISHLLCVDSRFINSYGNVCGR